MKNQNTLKLVKNPEFHKRIKHIDERFYFTREKYANGGLNMQYIASDDQMTDVMTNALQNKKFQYEIIA